MPESHLPPLTSPPKQGVLLQIIKSGENLPERVYIPDIIKYPTANMLTYTNKKQLFGNKKAIQKSNEVSSDRISDNDEVTFLILK